MINNEDAIKYIVLCFNLCTYNKDHNYEIVINNLNDIEKAKEFKNKQAENYLMTDGYFTFNGKRISESEVKEILNKRNL